MAWLPQKKKTTTTTATKHNRHRVTGTAQLESELACRVVRYFDLVRGEMNGARRTSSAIYGHLWMSATVNAAGIRNNGKFWFAVGDCTLSLSLFLLSADVSVSLSEQLFSCVCWGKRDFFFKATVVLNLKGWLSRSQSLFSFVVLLTLLSFRETWNLDLSLLNRGISWSQVLWTPGHLTSLNHGVLLFVFSLKGNFGFVVFARLTESKLPLTGFH